MSSQQSETFGTRLRASLATEPGAPVDALVRLAGSELGVVETIQLDHALRKVPQSARQSLPTTRLALLGSSTVDHLLPAIRVGGLRRRLWIEVYKGGYAQYRQEILNPDSALFAFKPETVLLFLTVSDVLEVLPLSARAADVESAIDEAVGTLQGLWTQAREKLGATVIQQSFLDISEPLFGSFDRLVPSSPSRLALRLNERVSEAAAASGVLWLDLAAAAARDGLDAWFDLGQWLHAKVQIAVTAAPQFGELLARVIAARLGLSKKCLVLDLDNTLWGGVLGDDGPDGIVLGEGNAVGEAHLALQRYAKQLKERGVVLAVCSRNDRSNVEAVFRDHPDMLLRPHDISAWAVNWSDKVTNLQAIASELNIGLDSLVFVDDNPVERAHVRESLPMVAVPELSSDPSHVVRAISRAGYFEAVSFSEEDRQRTSYYTANAERERLLHTTGTLDDFLHGLGMTVTFGPIGPLEAERASQLINKTNQFNTTGRRYSMDALRTFCAAPDHVALYFRLSDKFGDNGLVSVMLLRPTTSGALDVDCWVMSCRVFGRQLEQEAMNIAVETARGAGRSALTATFLPTPRNGVIAGLYEDLGFQRQDDRAAAPALCWRLPLTGYQPRRTAISRVKEP